MRQTWTSFFSLPIFPHLQTPLYDSYSYFLCIHIYREGERDNRGIYYLHLLQFQFGCHLPCSRIASPSQNDYYHLILWQNKLFLELMYGVRRESTSPMSSDDAFVTRRADLFGTYYYPISQIFVSLLWFCTFESVNFVTLFFFFLYEKKSGQICIWLKSIGSEFGGGGGTPIGNDCLLSTESAVVDGHALISFVGCFVHVVE